MTATCACGATWSGHKTEHCSANGCHLTFSGTSAGDLHRVGRPSKRRCLTVDQLLVKGLVPRTNRHGTPVWGRAAENPLYLASHDESDGLSGVGEGQYLTSTLEARKNAGSGEGAA